MLHGLEVVKEGSFVHMLVDSGLRLRLTEANNCSISQRRPLHCAPHELPSNVLRGLTIGLLFGGWGVHEGVLTMGPELIQSGNKIHVL